MDQRLSFAALVRSANDAAGHDWTIGASLWSRGSFQFLSSV